MTTNQNKTGVKKVQFDIKVFLFCIPQRFPLSQSFFGKFDLSQSTTILFSTFNISTFLNFIHCFCLKIKSHVNFTNRHFNLTCKYIPLFLLHYKLYFTYNLLISFKFLFSLILFNLNNEHL